MADNLPSLKHLRFNAPAESLPFGRPGGGGGDTPLYHHDRDSHARYLKAEVARVELIFDQVVQYREALSLSSEFGLTLNVVSEPGVPLAFESLNNVGTGNTPSIVLLNLRYEDTDRGLVTKAAVFVPYGQLKVLKKKIAAYSDSSKDKKKGPSNSVLLANIASISVAAFEALWTDPEALPGLDEVVWFELWVRKDEKDWEAQLKHEAGHLQLELPTIKLSLPEHIVMVVRATRRLLESSLDLLNTLSEVRIARPCSVGLTDLPGIEQEEWIDEALERIQWPDDDAPSVCLIDSGVNRGHPLIEPILYDDHMETVFDDGDRSDDWKHGTPMAGLAAFGDLRRLMLSTGAWEQLHRLESVKLVRQSTSHDPENYGAITLQAFALPDIASPGRPRVFCMAITAAGPDTKGNPTSWSSAIDLAAAGVEEGGGVPKVIVLAAGNVREHPDGFAYPTANLGASIEDPAQAWNAITVGAVSDRIQIEEDDPEAQACTAIAPRHGLSPFTRTAHSWRPDWPMGPDVVMEGGNLGRAPDGSCPHWDSLQPLSTSATFQIRPLVPFNATSAAAAQAARVGARITALYPDYRAETVRGLIVHAAKWPQALLAREGIDPYAGGRTEDVERLMRSFGYGVVDEFRAIKSLRNQATFIIENSLQPFKGAWNDTKLNECHLIALPWPRRKLVENPDLPVTLKVTLSYFIEPNPGTRTWERSQKYHYASCLLRFRPKHKDLTVEQFRDGLDADSAMGASAPTDPGWAVGGTRRGKSGSLVQDVWRGTTGQLADMGHIGVYPAKGWWAYRNFKPGHELHGCHLKAVNYSLIVSLETEANLPIYAEIEAAILRIEAGIDIPI